MITFKEFYLIDEGKKWDDFVNKAKAVGLAAAITGIGLPVTAPIMKYYADKIAGVSDQSDEQDYDYSSPARGPVHRPPMTDDEARNWPPSPVDANVPNDNNATNNDVQIDWEIIAQLEGARSNEFYVPRQQNNQNAAQGNSGVTIASGFDIGQHSEQEINTLFAAHPDIIARLLPFANITGTDAITRLNRQDTNTEPLTNEQINVIDEIVNTDRTDQIVTRYNDDSETNFTDLVPEFQTVIASVSFQYGNLESRTPTFWNHVTGGNWMGALNELRDFGDDYPTRRNTEADIWERGISRTNSQ